MSNNDYDKDAQKTSYKFKRIEPKDQDEWLKYRQSVLTATDMGAILGLNPYKSVAEILESKKTISFFENAYTWLGQQMEPLVVKAVNKVMRTSFELFKNSTFYVDQKLGLGATPDAEDKTILLECKSTKPDNAIRWSNRPPVYYLAQLYTQMICCDRQEGWLAILSTDLTQTSQVLNLPLTIYSLTRSDYIDKIIIKEVERFWTCQKLNKMYKVDRKQASLLEVEFRRLARKIK